MVLGVMWAMTAAIVGFSVGRISMYGETVYAQDEPGGESESRSEPKQGEPFYKNRLKRGKRGEENGSSWSVGSPVSGEVTAQREGDQPTVIIRPDGDKLYAPAGGKITRVFPMGNAFLFTTEFGAELYIQAGDVDDELMVRHYRPRILQNEVVGKGKLLLEFDRMGLEAEGISTEVSVSVENCTHGSDVKLTVGGRVKTGEEILQVKGA